MSILDSKVHKEFMSSQLSPKKYNDYDFKEIKRIISQSKVECCEDDKKILLRILFRECKEFKQFSGVKDD
jgi:hypothetical protein